MSSIDDVFALMAQSKDDLAARRFAAGAGDPSPATQHLRDAQEAAHDQYDLHIAHSSGTQHHDGRSFEDKANAVPHPPSNGNGSGWPGPGQPPPWWPPTKGGGGNGGGSSGNGGSGPPGWFKKWWQQQQQRGGSRGGQGGGSRGIGGGQLAGPGSLGGFPKLGNVPLAPAGATSSAPSPIIIVIVLASLGVGAYLLYHKLKLAKHQDAQLAAGKEPAKDDAS
jgi:hypothetical protein